MSDSKTPEKKEKKVSVTLKKHAYGLYRRAEPVGSKVMVTEEVAKRMKKTGHA